MFKTYPMTGFKALGDEGSGQFEAIVAVFNNVDRGGDMILPGAFTDTLAAWEAKGDPIPIVFAHQWDNLDAHIGQVTEAKEVEKGLYVKGQLEMDEPFAAKVYKKMDQRTLKEFSFAYDVVASNMIDNGKGESPRYVNELKQLDLLEVGPCLVGMNPETQLISVKDGWPTLGPNDNAELYVKNSIAHLRDLCAASGIDFAAVVQDSNPQDEGETDGEASDGKSGGDPSVLAAKIDIELMEL